MNAQSSYERIEYYLQELRTQTRVDAQTMSADPSAANVEKLITLFYQHMRELTTAEAPLTDSSD